MNIGIFGGTFDPVHTGHLIIAELILGELELDGIWFIPAAQPPHKPDGTITSFAHRAAMTELAIKDNPRMSVSRIEESLDGPSYTIQTLRHLSKLYPANRFYLIIGADSYVNFNLWKDPDSILEFCSPVVYPRQGFDCGQGDERLREKTIFPVLPVIDISSTVIRERLKNGHSVRYMVPDAVLDYMRLHQLYQR